MNGTSDMINTTDTTPPTLVRMQYAACGYMAMIIVAGISLNITSVVKLIKAIQVSFVTLQWKEY